MGFDVEVVFFEEVEHGYMVYLLSEVYLESHLGVSWSEKNGGIFVIFCFCL